ncbi:hypothetical protein LF63_0107210 [Oleiagrimonas soli]|nr:hypothetical protein LF63_0107210 [Oleiagrimonas soli]
MALAALAAVTLGAGVAHAAGAQTMIAHESVDGMSRLQAHHVLMQYCKQHGFGIVHDSLTSVACRKRVDGAPASYLAEATKAERGPYTPELTLHFRFVPDTDGVMHIRAVGSVLRRGPDGFAQRSLVPVGEVQAMLTHSREVWSAQHSQAASRS